MNIKTKNLVKSSLFLALGLIVPYVFMSEFFKVDKIIDNEEMYYVLGTKK